MTIDHLVLQLKQFTSNRYLFLAIFQLLNAFDQFLQICCEYFVCLDDQSSKFHRWDNAYKFRNIDPSLISVSNLLNYKFLKVFTILKLA